MNGSGKVSDMLAPFECQRRPSARQSISKSKGFTLLEMMVSTAVILVVVGGVVSAISLSEQTFSRTEVKSDMYENVRGVAELMTQEIGQAGLVTLPASSLSSAVNSNLTAQTVNVSSTASMFIGESLLIDAGTNEEQVTLTNVGATTITAIFGKNHVVGAPLTALGVFPSGIVPPGTVDGSSATVLNIVGDVNGDGSLVYVRYVCAPGTTAAPGTLTRSVTPITPGVNTISASQNLLTTLVASPGGTACFQYTTSTVTGFTFVNQLGITLTVQTTSPDPKTGQYATMTKSFLNLEPRNVMAGLEMVNANITNRLQATPPNVLLY
jgi:prepilin-type N-terminal cleavage/methylation domain-containing protein